MKNIINYYYNLTVDRIYHYDDYYFFYINNELYCFTIYKNKLDDIQSLYETNYQINNNLLEMVINKNKQIITIIDNIPYILYKIYFNIKKKISLQEINYLTNININNSKNLIIDNWFNLWTKKIDYFEYQINQTGKKYPIIVDSFSYFAGLTENAISYYQNTLLEEKKETTDNYVISHKKIKLNDSIFCLYNPTNIILDHPSRDIAEYIKLSFFKDNFLIFDELKEYFSYHYFSSYGIRLLIARVLFPSFYFDIYEDILLGKKEEKEIIRITSRINEYEEYLKEIIIFLKKIKPSPNIEWIIKKNRTY